MAPTILDGKSLAASMEREIADRVARLKTANGGHSPTLATILVGDDPASATYVRMKGNACRRVGMESLRVDLPGRTTTEELLERIDALNADPGVNGILLQHPVPHHVDERTCFDRIRADKDVDGVTALGFGRMSLGETAYGSATPAGIMRLLHHHGIAIAGRHAVVVGRSPILGKPMAGNVGDVDLEGAAARASAYTPVPGGVGPMTIALLLEQTVAAAEQAPSRTAE